MATSSPLKRVNKFRVSSDRSSDVSVAEFNPKNLEELDLFEAEIVFIGRNSSFKTLCVAISKDNVPYKSIRISDSIMKNICVENDSIVTIYRCDDCPYIEKLYIAPYRHSMSSYTGDLEQNVVIPFFSSFMRPLHDDDVFSVNVEGKEFEFYVQKITPLNYGLVTGDTRIVINPSISLDEFPYKTFYGYDKIGGLKEQIGLVRELIEFPLKKPMLYANLIKPPNKILLSGPSGSGKSLFAKAIANENSAFFSYVNCIDIASCKDVSEAVSKLNEIFKDAEDNSPSIVFLDDVDLITQKVEGEEGMFLKNIAYKFMSILDNIGTTKNVVLIGSTSRINVIDSRFRRFGRFSREIFITVPDEDGRFEILTIHTKKFKLADDVDLREIARNTIGFVGADIAKLCFNALYSVIRRLQIEDLEEINTDQILDKIVFYNDDFKNSLSETSPSALVEYNTVTSDVKFDDIGGLDELKEQLSNSISLHIRVPELFQKFDLDYSGNFLLFGPPGCGKTLIAKAIASELKFPMITVSSIFSKYIGESEKAIREVFERARRACPCVLFFDEIDSIAIQRGRINSSDTVLNAFLCELDGINPKKPIYVIAATNRPQVIDSALLRPGRFTYKVYVGLPNKKERMRIFSIHFAKNVVEDMDYDSICNATNGFSGADIAEFCSLAKKSSINRYLSDQNNIDQLNHKKNHPDDKMEEIDAKNYVITKDDIDFALKNSRASVTEASLKVYRDFAQQYSDEKNVIFVN